MLVAMPTAMPVEPLTSRFGNLRRQHRRLRPGLVVVGHEIHGVVPDVLHHLHGRGRHPGLGVSHGRRRVGVDAAEVALRVDQGIAHVPVLGHAHQRAVRGLVAVRVVVAAGIADDLRALAVLAAGTEVQVVHRHQDPPLRGLEAIPHVGQGPRHDHAHRVVEVRVLQLVKIRRSSMCSVGLSPGCFIASVIGTS